ncbi:MAG: nitronate monooxygenase [Acidimicrobiia bacterium]|nr:nitronate monooxygenase [Acidimicrobiia bacterium]
MPASATTPSGARDTLPRIIQGGMGVAVSGWPLANAVARRGELGVVSGTALEVVMARRLQVGDPGGHIRRALDSFPFRDAAGRIVNDYYVPGGKDERKPFKNVRSFTVSPDPALQQLAVAANFVEVFLAKEGHDGPVGINYLRKIEMPIPFSIYGAMLADVDYVIVGAGNPKDIPDLVARLARHEPVGLPLRIQGLTSADGDVDVRFDPADLHGGHPPSIRRPEVLGIVASVELASGLAALPEAPDGFIVEAPSAGGHNAPPRGPRKTDTLGQPIYDDRDHVELGELRNIGLPFWLAGSYGTPEGLKGALTEGAAGVQVGTAFAFSRESGLAPALKRQILAQATDGGVEVRSDWRASPTGFPFRIVQVPGTLSDENIYEDRTRVCDLGMLRMPYVTDGSSIGYRCPAEPLRAYGDIKGGRIANTEGRLCLCNGLLATAGLAQYRVKSAYEEPAVVTAGSDFQGVRDLMTRLQPVEFYTAADVIAYMHGESGPTSESVAQ